MEKSISNPLHVLRKNKINLAKTIALVALFLLLFLFSIEMTGLALSNLTLTWRNSLVSVLSNPLAAFSLGMLLTSLVQRSSTVTSLAVVAVGSQVMDIETAVFMVFGANIGTTLTSDLVALIHIFQKKSFQSAFAAAISHDLFNILTVFLLFPFEYKFHLIAKAARIITDFVLSKWALQLNKLPFTFWVNDLVEMYSNFVSSPILLLLTGLVLLIVSLTSLKTVFQHFLKDRGETFFMQLSLNKPYRNLGLGALITAFVQSSSLTTSLIALFSGSQRVPPQKIFPIIIGANIGTTITAFLAAIALSPLALTVAVSHLLFNFLGCLLFFPLPIMRLVPVFLAEKLAEKCAKNRTLVFIYLVVVFLLSPMLILYFSQK